MEEFRAYLTQVRETLRFTDVLDIIVVATLGYLVIRWARQARSRFVIVGLILMGVVYLVARLLALQLTLYVFQTVVTVAAVALVVIFQDDIRRGFERLATRARGESAVGLEAHALDALVTTIVSFASRKVGALVVLSGTEPLTRHLHGGEPLEGELSAPLLDSIFDASSDGHDGAVVVRGSTVVSFGVHLPLSDAVAGGGHLGTRHTAALGLAERCDAMVIVVSEERGTISIARDGKLEVVSPGDLHGRIREHLEAHEKTAVPSFLGSLLTRDPWGKALALGFAIGTWMLLFGSAGTPVTRIVPAAVVVSEIKEGWDVKDVKPGEVQVKLSGTERLIRTLEPGEVQVTTRLDDLQAGPQRIRINLDDITVPPGIRVLDVEPSSLTVSAHPAAVVEASVELRPIGRVPSGQRLVTEPAAVRLVVPAHLAKAYAKIHTARFTVDSIDTSTGRKVALSLPEGVHPAEEQPSSVTVRLVPIDGP